VHSVYEDFTFDRSDTMSGAGDDWAYEHVGVYSWSTEFWDVMHATGTKGGNHIWYTGPTDVEGLSPPLPRPLPCPKRGERGDSERVA
jgi:hypothetical protein